MKKSIVLVLICTFAINFLLFGNASAVNGTTTDSLLTLNKTASGWFKDVTYGNGMFVAVGKGGLTATSNDGLNWTTLYGVIMEDLNAITWTGKEYFSVGGNGSIINSVDGLKWNKVYTNKQYCLNSIVYSNGKYIAVGYDKFTYPSKSIILISENGLGWEESDYDGIGELNSIISSGSTFVIVGGYGDSTQTILSSKDGTKWVQRYDTKTLGDKYLMKVFYGGGKFVAVGGHVACDIVTSVDGENWQVGTCKGNPYTPYCGTWNGESYILFGCFDTLYKSKDGLNWETQKINILDKTDSIINVIFVDNKYIAVNSKGEILSSVSNEEKSKNSLSLPEKNSISSWAISGVEGIWNNELADKSIFSDYTKNITREEFAMLAVKLYEKHKGETVKITEVNKFNDISNCKYREEVLKANELGIVNGVGDGKFNPKGEITRQEIAVILLNTLKAINSNENYGVDNNVIFSDDSLIAPWAKSAVQYLYKRQILKGTGTDTLTFGSIDNTTREMAMLLIYRLGKSENIIQ